jgi:dipeptidyl aminopeptidase/acylaminoacyl peptidase
VVNLFRSVLQGAALAALIACAASAQPAPPAASGAPRIPTASDFGRLPAISSVTLSPDGKHIAAITTPDGVTGFISVWSTDAMDQKPFVINPAGMAGFQFFRVDFVKNDRLYVTFRQIVTGTGEADGSKNQRFIFQSVLMSPSKDGPPPAQIITKPPSHTDMDQFNGARVRLENSLPNDPRRIIVRDGADGTFYKVDVVSGQLDVLQRGSDTYDYYIDPSGEPRGRERSFGDGGAFHAVDEFRAPKGGSWDQLFQWYPKDREMISFAAFDDDPNGVLALSREGHEKAVIASYSIGAHKPPEVAFAHPFFEATGVELSHRASDYGHVIGFRYGADIQRIYWTDGQFEQLEQALRRALNVTQDTVSWVDPATGKRGNIGVMHDFDIRIMDYSNDMSRVLVEKSGPSQPPEYYLLTDGKTLVLLGKADPQIDLKALGQTRLVEYPARDGLMVPAFVTTPPKDVYGPGPYPAIVTPHGGPWARDEMDWDVTGWTQYFAARGYVVIQPQFRGSDGWGQKLWRAGDKEWGGKMEDDMEDGAKWLVAQHLADPHRMAIHGYSYGGYSAFDAAVRPNGLYRCAIAGAGVAEMRRFQELTQANGYIREYQRPTVEGVSPLEHIADVQIPVLAYHGDTDHTVSRTESERFTSALAAAHKPYKFVELPNMDHQLVYWTPQNWRDVLLIVDDFLKTSCGMGA